MAKKLKFNQLIKLSSPENYISELEKELRVTDKLLNDRQRVLDAIPECSIHGSCVPHAIEWINEQRGRKIDVSKQNIIKNLKIREKQVIKELDAICNLINLYKETIPDNNKKFVFLVKKAKDCLFSRREGYRGKIIYGYSFVVRLFGWNLTKW